MTILRDKNHGFTLERVVKGHNLIKGTVYEIVQRHNFWIVQHRYTGQYICRGWGLHNAAYRLRELMDAYGRSLPHIKWGDGNDAASD